MNINSNNNNNNNNNNNEEISGSNSIITGENNLTNSGEDSYKKLLQSQDNKTTLKRNNSGININGGGSSDKIDFSDILNNRNNNEITNINNDNNNNDSDNDKNMNEENKKTPFLVMAYLYFIVIASVLGTGILGLPVKLSQSGFTPFVSSYTLCFFMQLISMFFLIEILQRAYAIIKSNFSTTIPTISNSSSNNDIDGSISLDLQKIEPTQSSILSPDIINNNNDNNTNNNYEINDLSESTDSLNNHNSNSNNNNNKNKSSNNSSIRSSPPTLINNNNDQKSNVSFEDSPMLSSTKKQQQQQQLQQQQQPPPTQHDETPNLHNIGTKFMGRFSYFIFMFSVLLHFCSVLIGYGLAGTESYSLLFKIDESMQHYLILPVIVILTGIIIFGSKTLQHVITFCTFGKGTLLVVIVFITGIVSNHVHNDISNDFSYIGKSLLISTIALGGASSTLPVVFPKIVFTRKEIIKCYYVSGAALFTVYVLNIIWCYFLLNIIPQLPDPANPNMPSLANAAKNGEIATVPLMKVISLYYPQFLWIANVVNLFCSLSITISFISVGCGFKHTLDGFSNTWRTKSLSNSHHDENDDIDYDGDDDDNQQHHHHHHHHHHQIHNDINDQEELEDFTNEFYHSTSNPTSSPSSPHITSGGGSNINYRSKISTKFKVAKQNILKSSINQSRKVKFWFNDKLRLINSFIDSKEGQSTWETSSAIVRIPIREYLFYTLFFGFILLVALLNPRGFLFIMETGTSFGLNMIAGWAMYVMITNSRNNYGHYPIPAELPQKVYMLRYPVFFYFTFAVLYDIYVVIFNK
ncbi:hypothetical protein ACTFIT_008802 [Dictyostelium discoideum]